MGEPQIWQRNSDDEDEEEEGMARGVDGGGDEEATASTCGSATSCSPVTTPPAGGMGVTTGATMVALRERPGGRARPGRSSRRRSTRDGRSQGQLAQTKERR